MSINVFSFLVYRVGVFSIFYGVYRALRRVFPLISGHTTGLHFLTLLLPLVLRLLHYQLGSTSVRFLSMRKLGRSYTERRDGRNGWSELEFPARFVALVESTISFYK